VGRRTRQGCRCCCGRKEVIDLSIMLCRLFSLLYLNNITFSYRKTNLIHISEVHYLVLMSNFCFTSTRVSLK
jgi:hypothetical protein